MTPVNFYRGLDAHYNKENHKNGIYFSMDKHVIYHDGKTFGGIDPQYFSGVTKDFDIDGSTVKFKALGEDGTWKDVTIQLVQASDSSVEIGTITNAEGTVNDGFTVKVKADYAAADKDGLKLDKSKGLYVDLTHTTAAIAANTNAITTLNGADTVEGSVAKSIKDAIEALDSGSVGGDGKVITTISQTNGQVSASAIDLTASNVKATASTGSTSAVAVDGNTVSAQIASLATSIKSVESGKTYTISAVTSSETNVKEAFALVDGGGHQAGATIKIYKDSSLKSVALDGQTLNFTYILATGSESTVGVDVSTFLAESEFSDGLQVVDHVVSVKKDSASESFLTVSDKGVKVSGVQDAIDKAAAKATTKVEKAANADKITLASATDANGSVTYTIGQNDIASAALLGTAADNKDAATAFGKIAKEVADREAAIKGLKLDSVGGNGQVITTISQADGKVSATAATLGAENVTASTIASGNTTVAVTGDTVEAQIASLATSIKTVSTAAAAAHTKVTAKDEGHVKVTVAKSNDNTHDVVTITENDIASATALTAETSSRVEQDDKIEASIGLDANGNHVKTSGNYTKDATTVVGEIAALDTKLKQVSDTLLWIDCGGYGE